jgi:hypothetical protein
MQIDTIVLLQHATYREIDFPMLYADLLQSCYPK